MSNKFMEVGKPHMKIRSDHNGMCGRVKQFFSFQIVDVDEWILLGGQEFEEIKEHSELVNILKTLGYDKVPDLLNYNIMLDEGLEKITGVIHD